jgi:type IV secretory pathway ATPase VirB11/archaellum biosynthesis ATPase
MKSKTFGIIRDGRVFEVNSGNDITALFRDSMIKAAAQNGKALAFDPDTARARQVDLSEIPTEPATPQPKPVTEMDAAMALITRAADIKPADLEMSDIKWKYLVRSAVRGKNIMMVGPAGCGKTQAAKALINVPVTKELEVTEEEYQALLKDPNVISVTKL